jgi:hypothetical protein
MNDHTSAPAYLPLVLAALAGDPPAPGTLTEVRVMHDDDCGIWFGGPCNCSPNQPDVSAPRTRQFSSNPRNASAILLDRQPGHYAPGNDRRTDPSERSTWRSP